jgi:MFS family permease
VLIGVALVLFAQAPVDGDYVRHVLPVMVLLGTGAGIAFPALMTLAMSDATPADAGLASGLVNTTVQVSGAIGLAVLATISATHSQHLIGSGDAPAAALTDGYHVAFLIGAVLIGAAITVALTVLRQPRPERAPAMQPAYSEA